VGYNSVADNIGLSSFV